MTLIDEVQRKTKSVFSPLELPGRVGNGTMQHLLGGIVKRRCHITGLEFRAESLTLLCKGLRRSLDCKRRGFAYTNHYVELLDHKFLTFQHSAANVRFSKTTVPIVFTNQNLPIERRLPWVPQPPLKPRVTLRYSINHVGQQGAWFRMLHTWHWHGSNLQIKGIFHS